MIIGIPKEIKDNEYRVALPPNGVRELVRHGHQVVVQGGAGAGSAFSDDEYVKAGANVPHTEQFTAQPAFFNQFGIISKRCGLLRYLFP